MCTCMCVCVSVSSKTKKWSSLEKGRDDTLHFSFFFFLADQSVKFPSWAVTFFIYRRAHTHTHTKQQRTWKKEVRGAMSNRGGGEGKEEGGGMVTNKKKGTKNIYGPTHWASGREARELQPCVGAGWETLFCLAVVASCHAQTEPGRIWGKKKKKKRKTKQHRII